MVYRHGRERVDALQAVSLQVAPGERVGIVGESGSGKSTLARAILGLTPTAAGTLRFRGRNIAGFDRGATRAYRHQVQMIFQDAVGSLNPRMTVAATLGEVLRVHAKVRDRAAARSSATALLARVGLGPETLDAYPRELSGGQCQRVSLARALTMEPVLLIADEPVSALDVSVQARVLRLLRELSEQFHLACLTIAHDLAMVRQICDRVLVMHAGRIVEEGAIDAVLEHPRHPYTQALLAAVPDIDRALAARGPCEKRMVTS